MSDNIPAVASVGEMAKSVAGLIESKVQRIRELRDGIDEKKATFGITDDEDEIAQARADLLAMVRDYKDMTGENWSDGEGFARYISAGETHRYDTRSVDEALAAILTLIADMENVASSNLDVAAESESADGDALSLSEMIARANDVRFRVIEEFTLRLNAMNVEIKRLASARKVSTTSETVHVK